MNENIKDNELYTLCTKCLYSLYTVDWMQRISMKRKTDEIKNYFELILAGEIDKDCSYVDYLEEYGYSGEMFATYNEFCENEFLDTEYMNTLIGSSEIIKNIYESIVREIIYDDLEVK